MKSKNQTIDREVTGTKTRQIQEQELERRNPRDNEELREKEMQDFI